MLVLCLALLCMGCSRKPELGIYLLRDPNPNWVTAELDLKAIDLSPEAIIGLDDIRWYDEASHELELSTEAMKRMKELRVPLSGLPFIIRVDDESIYVGAFVTPISSFALPCAVVMQPFGDIATLRVELGYPSPDWYSGQDPRGDQRILDALRNSKKLR
jgi:hypothetical protein